MHDPYGDGASGELPERSRLRFGSVPPSVKPVGVKPVYVVMPAANSEYTAVRPAVYDPYYGVNYIPSSGRDSWSAYHISDAALDDNDELVFKSRERDSHFLKEVNRKLASVLNDTPAVARPKTVPRVAKATVRAVPSAPGTFAARQPPPPHRKPLRAADLEQPRPKLFEEVPYSESPSDLAAIRAQLRDTTGRLDKQRQLLQRYRSGRDAVAIRSVAASACPDEPDRRSLRATSLQPESSQGKLSAVRSHIRDVLERSRQKP